MYTFLLCTYTSAVSGLTLILTLALSLLYLNTYTSTVTDSAFTLSLKLTQNVSTNNEGKYRTSGGYN